MRWIIGDIHGMLRPLETLLRAVEREDSAAELLFVGDYVNRGPDSRGVIDLLLSLPRARFVRGNHDDVFDQVVHDQCYCSETGPEHRRIAFQWFMQHGLDVTFKSYGIADSELNRALRKPTPGSFDYLADFIPPEHRKFIRNLPPLIDYHDLFVLHAKWEVNQPTDSPSIAERLATAAQPLRYNILWGRYGPPEIASKKNWTRTGYFGHTPVDMYTDRADLLPVIGPQIVLLDTAAALTSNGRLTAFCHETQNFLQADPVGNLLPR